MKHCDNCKISYKNDLDVCLICGDDLRTDEDHLTLEYNYTKYVKESVFKKYFLKSFILLNIVSILVTLYIDYTLNKSLSFSLIVGVSNLYLIFFVKVALNNKSIVIKGIEFLFLSAVYFILLGISIDSYDWVIDLVLPFILIANTLMLTIMSLVKRNDWQKYAVFLLISIFANILIILINILGFSQIKWAITASFLYGVATLISLLIFTPKNVKEEILRIFHL